MTSDGLEVRVDDAGIIAGWEANDGEVWIEFAPDRPAEPELFSVLHDAVVGANEALSPYHFGTGVDGSVAGGALMLKFPPGPQAIRDWLAVFARQVQAEGWGGSVHVAPGVREPGWLRNLLEPRLTVYVSYDAAAAGEFWPDLCERAAQWALRNGGPGAYLLSSGLMLPDRTGGLGRHMYLALTCSASIAATCFGEQAEPVTRVSLAVGGRASYQVHRDRQPPLALAGQAREAMLAACGRTRWAGIGLDDRSSYGWLRLKRTLGQTPPVPSWASGRNDPVWSRYVPDAFGMQLLTGEHLSRVRDLSGWIVTEPAPGSYLVEAPNLADWLKPEGPSAEVVAAARADFGQAIAPADLPKS